MRRKEGRKKQARSNKQQGKATQHTQGIITLTHMYVPVAVCECLEVWTADVRHLLLYATQQDTPVCECVCVCVCTCVWATNQYCMCMTCNTPSVLHTADEAWHWVKRVNVSYATDDLIFHTLTLNSRFKAFPFPCAF